MKRSLSLLKQDLRNRLHKENGRHSPLEKDLGSKTLLQKVTQLPAWEKATTILLYAPLEKEPNLLGLLKDKRRRFLFPRMEGANLKLYYWFLGAPWVRHQYGIEEPDPAIWEEAPLEAIDLALIPGVGFDQQGARLGWGRGYYDRLFQEQAFDASKIGCAWPWQVIPKVPQEAHDVMMDQLLVGG